jgi:tRNA A-37 threonylcarbamoyl transferase component Bud32
MSAEDLAPGSTFHGLQIVEVLGRGGMGVVYKARQPDLDRFVALKILPERLARDPDFVQRFRREAKALAALSHPNIVAIFDFGAEAGRCFFVMEHVDGTNLRALLREGLQMPEQPLQIVRQICDALEFAHAEGVVHRDIKPENILVDRKGRVKIADFGLAKMAADDSGLTQTNLVMGTPPYMAPEQYDAPKGVDARADIYALGVMFHEMLTGAHPPDPYVPPSKCLPVDDRLDRVVEKALRRRRDERYQRAADLKSDLETAVTVRARRRRDWRPVAVAAGAILLGGLGIFFLVRRKAPVDPPPAKDPFVRLGPERFKGCDVEGEELVFVPGPERTVRAECATRLPRRFTLRYRLRYEIKPSQEPWIILELGETRALWMFPENDHVAALMEHMGAGWGMREKQPMPRGPPSPGAWCEVEVRSLGARLQLSVDGKPAFDYPVEEPVAGNWAFAMGGAWREARIRDVRLKDDDQP